MADDNVEYELERPFVTTVSHGGPHDDRSYVAGFQMGRLDVVLGTPYLQKHEETIYTASVQQADLIAMHYDFTTEVLGEDDEWTTVLFTRICICDDTLGEKNGGGNTT